MEAQSSDDELDEGASDVDKAENAANDAALEAMDDIEVEEEEAVSEDDSDDDDDAGGPDNIDANGFFVAPKGYDVLSQPPSDFSLRNLKKLRVRLAIKWPYGDDWGWVIGNFKKMSTSGKHKNAFVIRGDDGVQTYWPKEPNCEYGADRKWVLTCAE